ncbi:MAG: ABC transporter permease [Synechococcaceae cyanobacterium SM2_3_1]|nr:ABC transporter permease [Synechococcaceae cyanobacterium SM2_3_1]
MIPLVLARLWQRGAGSLVAPSLAILAALLAGAGLILLAGANPLVAYQALVQESLANYYGFANTLTRTAPLLLTSLGVVVALRAGQINLGGEGQIYLGGLGSTVVALWLSGSPGWIHLPMSLLGGFCFGGLWGLIPGYLKVNRGINEVITTLLLNYVGLHLISYLVSGPLLESGAPSPYSPLLDITARLPLIMPRTQAHAGILLGLVLALVLSLLFRFTPLGYQITAVGLNPVAARYAGMSVGSTVLLSMVLAGGLAGLAGSCEVLGSKYRLFENFSPGYGFDAIVIGVLSRGNLAGVILTSFFFGALRSGANVLQRSAGVPVTVVFAIQGLMILFVAMTLAWEQQRLRHQPSPSPPERNFPHASSNASPL